MSAPGLKTAAGSSKISGKFPFGMDVAALLGLFLTTMVRDENKNRQWVKVLLLLLIPCLISVAWLIDRNIK
ncbi:MAG: hypothetical protein JWR60_1020, partial [Polaromonas sp.]|nr:hypothetical protein [Polaromonas sp.]